MTEPAQAGASSSAPSSRAPRVLVAGSVLGQPMGGVRRHNAELLPRVARLLEERGGALAVLEGRERIAFPLPPGVERIPSDVPAAPPLARAAFESRALAAALALARRRGRPFELVHTGHLPAPRRLETPFTLTLHDLRHVQPWNGSALRAFAAGRILADALRRARGVFCVTASVREELCARFALRPERVRLVPNAGDHFVPRARDAGAGSRILCLGHLEPRKNQELVLRALALDPALPGVDFAGASKGGEDARLARLARELGVAERVRFLGAFEEGELAELYARAACAILPARIEGFGIGVLEAQLARCPLAISRIPAHLEVAGARVPSFDPGSPEQCRAALQDALALGSATLELCAQQAARYRWDDSAAAWVAGWQAALGPPGS